MNHENLPGTLKLTASLPLKKKAVWPNRKADSSEPTIYFQVFFPVSFREGTNNHQLFKGLWTPFPLSKAGYQKETLFQRGGVTTLGLRGLGGGGGVGWLAIDPNFSIPDTSLVDQGIYHFPSSTTMIGTSAHKKKSSKMARQKKKRIFLFFLWSEQGRKRQQRQQQQQEEQEQEQEQEQQQQQQQTNQSTNL